MQPPPNEVTATSFEGKGGGKSPQNNNKTQTNIKTSQEQNSFTRLFFCWNPQITACEHHSGF